MRIALLLAVSSCDTEELPEPLLVEVPDAAVRTSMGILEDGSHVQEFTQVRGARLSASGRYLAVIDAVPPYLRILDSEDGSAWAFGDAGDGPGELGYVLSADFLGDSSLVILSGMPGMRYDRFSLRGEWEEGLRSPAHGILASALTTACDDQIFVYGAPDNHRFMDTVPWLHEVHMDQNAQAEPWLAIPGRPGQSVRWGALFGLDGTDEGIWVWHIQVQSGVQAGYWIPCDGSVPRLIDHIRAGRSVEQAFEAGGQEGHAMTLPDTMFSGAAAQPDAMVRAFWERDAEPDVTSLRVHSDGHCSQVDLLGRWTLYDLHQDMLVLTRTTSHPVVQALDWDWIKEHLTDVPCA